MIVSLGAIASMVYLTFIREVPLSKAAKELDREYRDA